MSYKAARLERSSGWSPKRRCRLATEIQKALVCEFGLFWRKCDGSRFQRRYWLLMNPEPRPFDMDTVVSEVEERLAAYDDLIEVSVLGSPVNGIGEARDSDFGITGAKDTGMIFAKGQPLKKVPPSTSSRNCSRRSTSSTRPGRRSSSTTPRPTRRPAGCLRTRTTRPSDASRELPGQGSAGASRSLLHSLPRRMLSLSDVSIRRSASATSRSRRLSRRGTSRLIAFASAGALAAL
jgi:hypothetical protein